jgi:cytidylate kinase
VTLVTLSASYGAGGAVVGPAVAERLGVPFLDRAIPLRVAEQLEVPVEAATAHDEDATESGFLDRLLRGFLAADIAAPAPLPVETLTSEDFCRAAEQVLRRQADTGEGVILGRAGAVVLRDHPHALRVRLDGPRAARIEQAVRLGGIDRATAERALRHLDRAHADYTKRFYGADIADPSLYHLVIDSTAIPLEDCVELIVLAARARGGEAVRRAGVKR